MDRDQNLSEEKTHIQSAEDRAAAKIKVCSTSGLSNIVVIVEAEDDSNLKAVYRFLTSQAGNHE